MSGDRSLDGFGIPAGAGPSNMVDPALVKTPIAVFVFAYRGADVADQDVRRTDAELGNGGLGQLAGCGP